MTNLAQYVISVFKHLNQVPLTDEEGEHIVWCCQHGVTTAACAQDIARVRFDAQPFIEENDNSLAKCKSAHLANGA